MIVLPLEVEHLILEQLDDEEPTLLVSGFVCKSWLRASRSRVFSDVTLTEAKIKPFFDLAEASLLPLCSFIRVLTLDANGYRLRQLDNIRRLVPCPRVTDLVLSDMHNSDLAIHLEFLRTTLPSVSSLNIILKGWYAAITTTHIMATS
jgi:hypothetical protein